jgi:hypothetical protein
MLRDAARDEVRKVAAPLWLLVNQSLAPADFDEFNIIRSGACSVVAHLAYCAIGADEKERKSRAKVVPCSIFQQLLAAEEFDFVEALRSADFQDVDVVRTRSFVAVIIPARELFLIGVRGTQFAYDWLINLNIGKATDASGARFHGGFLREARELAEVLSERLGSRYAQYIGRFGGGCTIWLSGHSLGGAIAAILNQMQLRLHINACYTFGAPRISGAQTFSCAYPPFATRRYLDVVPHCPPRAFGYSDFSHQISPDGMDYVPASGIEMYFFLSWLGGLAINHFPKNHSMERYRFEVIEEVKRHPRNQSYWKPEYDFPP